MCILSSWTTNLSSKLNGEGYYVPLGRSSDDQDWIRPPGDKTHSILYNCGTATNSGTHFDIGEYLCEVTLPMTSTVLPNGVLSELDVPYYLTYYERLISVRDELSRFLQRTTFGPTSKELDALEVAYVDMGGTGPGTSSHVSIMSQLQTEWVQAQQDPSTFTTGKFTSLREYYRKRLNPRMSEVYRIGEAGPHPCEKHSRWRKFAFTAYDVVNSQYLRWGNNALGGFYQQAIPHKVTVETVKLSVPTEGPTGSPTVGVGVPTMSPVGGRSYSPTISSAPTGSSIIPYGDMEGDETYITNRWPSKCTTNVVNIHNTTDPSLVYSGEQSLYATGGRCFVMRQLGVCPVGRLAEAVNAGDLLRIAFMVRLAEPDQVFQVNTAHYHAGKERPWSFPDDHSNIIVRRHVPNANEWIKVVAYHRVGPDWTYGRPRQLLPPESCSAYQLRFMVAGSSSDFVLDDVRVEKVYAPPASLAETPPRAGFISNPKFEYNHAHYKFSRSAGYVRYDPDIGRNAMILPSGKAMRQNVIDAATEDETYQFSFLIKLVNVESVNLRIVMRMRFENNDVENGPCKREICNFFRRALARDIHATEENNGWQRITSSRVHMFGNYTEWNGNVDFILMQVFPKEALPEGGEIHLADFTAEDPELISMAPSISTSPSSSPTNLVKEGEAYIIRYAGEIRTIIRHPFQVDLTGEILPMDGSRGYNLCDVDEVEGRLAEFPNRLSVMYNNNCVRLRGGNPTVDLDPTFLSHEGLNILDLSSSPVVPINEEQTLGGDWLLQAPVDAADVCEALPTPYDNDYRGADPLNPDAIPNRFNPDKPVFALLPDGTYALYDPRLIVKENTIENPLMDGGGDAVIRTTLRKNNFVANTIGTGDDTDYFVYNDKNIALCSNEEPNYLNFDHCKLSYEENACQSDRNSFVDVSLAITFNEDSLREVNIASGRSIYAVSNLRYDAANTGGIITDAPRAYLQLPCMDRHPRSRWIPRPDLDASTCSNTLQAQSVAALKRTLEISNDENPFLRDVILWNNRDEEGCALEDKLAFGMLIMTSEGCWENVHPNHMSVYDFTDYSTLNPSSPLNITGSAEGILVYPDTEPMSYWEDLKYSANITYVTRYGDKEIVDKFADTLELDTDPDVLVAIAQRTGKIMVKNKIYTSRGSGVLVCGSPNEVASDPLEDDYFDVVHQDADCVGCLDAYGDYFAQKQSVWTMAILGAEDQLCQKMAWALYELINTGTATNPHNTESNLYVYDTYTRNCFGNYFDIMKEMTYSPKMAEQFNFERSSSQRYQSVYKNATIYPDENFAREIMQLYTIGLHELNDDGTQKKDKFGRVIRTYNNEDILSNARLFTGWDYTARRGNTEVLFRTHKSRMEPMRHRINKHDFFPKSSVSGGWIGDRYPLCVDLPKQHFLKIGARFRLLGGSDRPRFHYNDPNWEGDEGIKRFVLEEGSALYQKLCNPTSSGDCQFSNTVTLDENIPCYGKECRADTLVVVQVAPGTFYEYIRKACVQLSFYNGAKKVFTGVGPYLPELDTRQYTHSMCADPRLEEASRICCMDGAGQYSYKFEYHGELVNYETNEEQCLADGGTVCDPLVLRAFTYRMASTRTRYDNLESDTNLFFWTSDPCEQQVKVRSDGLIAFVHKPKYNPDVYDDTVPYVDFDFAATFIKLPWQKDPVSHEEMFPSIENSCGDGACLPTLDDMCLCGVTVTDTPVFASVPSREEALASLKIGAHDPALFSDASVTYSLVESTGEVDAYVASDAATIFSTSTIFKVTNEFGETIFLKNMESGISLGATSYEIRNPPSFINLVAMTNRDFDYEVDAFLTDLIRYQSTAPHVSKRLTQVFGTSNPSPSYVSRVTQAFRSGTFVKNGISFGDGKYGNLQAVAAAITLDPEFMSVVGDEDPIAGQVREPLLKVMAFLRSMEFKRRPNVKFRHGLFQDMHVKIGQMVFQPPDQFSFFDPGFSPIGGLGAAGLVSPESEVLTMASITGITNGFFSLNTWGLVHAGNGWGTYLTKVSPVGDYSSSTGYVTYNAVGDDIYAKIDDLSTLLTAGRLSPENKQVLAEAHSFFSANYGPDRGDRVLIELLSTAPEFHTSNTLRKTGLPRSLTPLPNSTSTDYKAIVYVDLFGGADSFNILTPHPDGGCYLYDDYYTARGGEKGIGLTIDEIDPIDGSSAGIAGCTKMGVHKKLPVYKNIFDEGAGMFFANMGHLHKPVTKDNWITETQTDLFSHTTMKRESHRVDAFLEANGPGVLGRMLDVLQGNGYVVSATSMDRKAQMIDGDPKTKRLADVVSSSGPRTIYEREFMNWREGTDTLRPYLEQIHSETVENTGMFGDMWSQNFLDVWNKAEALTRSLKATHLITDFISPTDVGDINKSLRIVAEMIVGRNKRIDGLNRDVFYIQLRGFDHHNELKQGLEISLPSLNRALSNFWNEIKAQGIQNNVLVIQGSEFGRTISPNSNRGSDHGWGGNYFMFGGDVKGGQILGEYPLSFSEADPTNIGRGRLMPTTSWEAMWYGVSQWFGIDSPADVEAIIPNSRNFGCNLFSETDLFHSGTGTVAGCGGPTFTTSVDFNVDESRYLTGEEQKLICDLAVEISSDRLSTEDEDIRCYISDQTIIATDTGYVIEGDAVLNFDYTINENKLNAGLAQRITKEAETFASTYVVQDASPETLAPTGSPTISMSPTVTAKPTLPPTTASPPTPPPTNSTIIIVDPELATQEYCKSFTDKVSCGLTGSACEWDQRFKGTCYLTGTAPDPDICITNNKPCPEAPNQCCTGICNKELNRCD